MAQKLSSSAPKTLNFGEPARFDDESEPPWSDERRLTILEILATKRGYSDFMKHLTKEFASEVTAELDRVHAVSTSLAQYNECVRMCCGARGYSGSAEKRTAI